MKQKIGQKHHILPLQGFALNEWCSLALHEGQQNNTLVSKEKIDSKMSSTLCMRKNNNNIRMVFDRTVRRLDGSVVVVFHPKSKPCRVAPNSRLPFYIPRALAPSMQIPPLRDFCRCLFCALCLAFLRKRNSHSCRDANSHSENCACHALSSCTCVRPWHA